ncbi:unnamed protein product [Gadus morhua 'NCC']
MGGVGVGGAASEGRSQQLHESWVWRAAGSREDRGPTWRRWDALRGHETPRRRRADWALSYCLTKQLYRIMDDTRQSEYPTYITEATPNSGAEPGVNQGDTPGSSPATHSLTPDYPSKTDRQGPDVSRSDWWLSR